MFKKISLVLLFSVSTVLPEECQDIDTRDHNAIHKTTVLKASAALVVATICTYTAYSKYFGLHNIDVPQEVIEQVAYEVLDDADGLLEKIARIANGNNPVY